MVQINLNVLVRKMQIIIREKDYGIKFVFDIDIAISAPALINRKATL
jgi:hypothetical protein